MTTLFTETLGQRKTRKLRSKKMQLRSTLLNLVRMQMVHPRTMRHWKTIRSRDIIRATLSKSTLFVLFIIIHCRVRFSEIIDNKYILLRKLGWGHFSVVWLALKLQDKKLYALKIQKSADKYTESAMEEEEILYEVASNYQNKKWEQSVREYLKDPDLEINRTHTHNLQMYDQFFHHAMFGRHSVMAFEVLGRNLLTLIKRFNYEGIPMPIVREITKQNLMGLDYLHRICKIIHTDLKPENVVFEIENSAKLDMLEEEVLNTPLIELYEYTEPIILNKKQLLNHKKNQRKRKNKAAAKAAAASQDNLTTEQTNEDADEERKTVQS